MARLIQLQTRSPFHHAALIAENGEVFEAIGKPFPFGKVVKAKSFSSNHKPGEDIDVFEVTTPYMRTKSMKWMKKQIGKGYDYRSVLRFLTRVPAKKNQRYFCSELIFEYFTVGSLPLLKCIAAHNVSPRDLVLSPFLRHTETWVTV